MNSNATQNLQDLIASVQSVLEGKSEEQNQRKFVFHHMGSTDISHGDLKKKYKQKFGHTNNFDNHVTSFMDSN